MYEIRRVIAGQDALLERGVRRASRPWACPDRGRARPREDPDDQDRGCRSRRHVQACAVHARPVPSDLVGTRIYRAVATATFDIELGPVFCNFLLADEINRAPAKVQSALLEVMQEGQVTIARNTHAVPSPFLVMATQNRSSPRGRACRRRELDRFMLKVLVDYPGADDELVVMDRALARPRTTSRRRCPSRSSPSCKRRCEAYTSTPRSFVTLEARSGARDLSGHGSQRSCATYVEYGVSPARRRSTSRLPRARWLCFGAAATSSPRTCASWPKTSSVTGSSLSYEALADDVSADTVLDGVLRAVEMP